MVGNLSFSLTNWSLWFKSQVMVGVRTRVGFDKVYLLVLARHVVVSIRQLLFSIDPMFIFYLFMFVKAIREFRVVSLEKSNASLLPEFL